MGEGELPSMLVSGWIVKSCLRNNHNLVESLWVKVKDWSSKGHLVVGVYYKPPDQG